mgnify:CR=1 FL=1
MITTNIHNAKTNLSKLVALAAAGEKVIICKNNIPMAQLMPMNAERATKPVRFGRYEGKIKYDPDIFKAMTAEEVREEFGEDWA